MKYLLCAAALFLATPAVAGTSDDTYREWFAEVSERAELPATSGTRLDRDALEELAKSKPKLPYRDLTCGVRLANGTLWLGSEHGLLHRRRGKGPWRVFHSQRYLPDNHVLDVSVGKRGQVFVRTQGGIARVYQKKTSLTEKMAEINDALQRWHVREGFIAELQLNEPGRPEAGIAFVPSSDNDGLWTSLYVAAEAYRFGTTGDPAAKRNARRSLEALMKLERITGISGFCARSWWHGEEDPAKIFGGEWHKADEGDLWWKGDTSSDELDGHYYAYAIYYDLCADDAEKSEIREYVRRITDNLLDNGLYYLDVDGKPTTWGVFPPERLNHDLKWLPERGLNSLETLSHLKVAIHIVGDSRYQEAYDELINDHAYHMNTVRQKIIWPARMVNHSDDELAFVAYLPLLWYERDPELRKVYLASIHRSFEIERPERSPYFNYIYAAALQANEWTDPSQRPTEPFVSPEAYDAQKCVNWFRGVPRDMIRWRVVNSDRADVGKILKTRFGHARSRRVLPVAERPFMRWNGDPYELDGGGDGRSRNDGAHVLVAYWMGRYHRFLD